MLALRRALHWPHWRSLASQVAAADAWRGSRVAADATHHVALDGEPLYAPRFRSVLPFHSPGHAPAQLQSGAWCHISASGEPAYAQRYRRTFGFYEGRAAVAVTPTEWRHIAPDGTPAYARLWTWVGNFCCGAAVVRKDDDAKRPRYRHILRDGSLLPAAAPYAYAGDFREGYAVVRDAHDGLCDHVGEDGARMHRAGPLFDLDVFHKGFARARDARGWFFLDSSGRDAMAGARYAQLEPFYNGVAAAQRHDGARVLLSDDTMAECGAIDPGAPDAEHVAALHALSVAYWAPLALRMGLQAGLAGDADDASSSDGHLSELRPQLRQAWQELGLLDTAGALTRRGRLLLPGRVARERASDWLGPFNLHAWAEVAGLLRGGRLPAVQHFVQPLVQRVLDSYARDDWAGLAHALPLPPLDGSHACVADLGGGQGALLRQMKELHPQLDCVLVDLPPVVAQAAASCTDAGVRCFAADLLAQPPPKLPRAQLYLLTRVLHDWPDGDALRILRAVRAAAHPHARLCVVERDTAAGLLSLHMGVVLNARERDAADWRRLFAAAGWVMMTGEQRRHAGHAVMCLRPV